MKAAGTTGGNQETSLGMGIEAETKDRETGIAEMCTEEDEMTIGLTMDVDVETVIETTSEDVGVVGVVEMTEDGEVAAVGVEVTEAGDVVVLDRIVVQDLRIGIVQVARFQTLETGPSVSAAAKGRTTSPRRRAPMPWTSTGTSSQQCSPLTSKISSRSNK